MGLKLFGTMLSLLLLALVSGCSTQAPQTGQQQNESAGKTPAHIQMCLMACNNTLEAGDTGALELGNCLMDRIPIEPDWVCDVAHSPRTAVDDNPHNQCQSYLMGETHHFVEVSPECRLIRAV